MTFPMPVTLLRPSPLLVSKAHYEVLIADETFARPLAAKYGAEVQKTEDG